VEEDNVQIEEVELDLVRPVVTPEPAKTTTTTLDLKELSN